MAAETASIKINAFVEIPFALTEKEIGAIIRPVSLTKYFLVGHHRRCQGVKRRI
jgi:hypothetical protein